MSSPGCATNGADRPRCWRDHRLPRCQRPRPRCAHTALGDALERTDRLVLVLPASGFAEVLVGPSRNGTDAVNAVRDLVDRLPIAIEPIDAAVAVAAAAIRARHRSLKLPDALVIATAGHLDADHLITTNRGAEPDQAQVAGLDPRDLTVHAFYGCRSRRTPPGAQLERSLGLDAQFKPDDSGRSRTRAMDSRS